jgi:hypothetical protein
MEKIVDLNTIAVGAKAEMRFWFTNQNLRTKVMSFLVKLCR